LPVLRRILGRERNLAIAPDGRKFYPTFAAEVWADIAPIRQIQLVQKSRTRIEVRLAMPRPLSGEETRRLTAALLGCLVHPYELAFTCMESIPRSPGGKYEDFVVELEG
jgi:phenylacetate-CoA ligase